MCSVVDTITVCPTADVSSACLARKSARSVREVKPPTPPKPRRATKPGRGAIERRHEAKKRRAGVKALRGRVSHD